MQIGLKLLFAGYTRIPVYEKDPQDIIGILYTKDLILVDPGDFQASVSALFKYVSFAIRTLARQTMAGSQNLSPPCSSGKMEDLFQCCDLHRLSNFPISNEQNMPGNQSAL